MSNTLSAIEIISNLVAYDSFTDACENIPCPPGTKGICDICPLQSTAHFEVFKQEARELIKLKGIVG